MPAPCVHKRTGKYMAVPCTATTSCTISLTLAVSSLTDTTEGLMPGIRLFHPQRLQLGAPGSARCACSPTHTATAASS